MRTLVVQGNLQEGNIACQWLLVIVDFALFIPHVLQPSLDTSSSRGRKDKLLDLVLV